MSWYDFPPYVSVAERRAKAKRAMAKLAKHGRTISPVTIEGTKIARTFWGKAWCDNLESYSDFASRMPRGRTYVRNGSVCDLQVSPGGVTAVVSGSELYDIRIKVAPLPKVAWAKVKAECAGQIGSLIELLQGRLSAGVMGVVTRTEGGLFPKPKEIDLDCSCPDGADMCKHVAAALYGVGARLDEKPDLLFLLRGVDPAELIAGAGEAAGAAGAGGSAGRATVAAGDLADVFGIELAGATDAAAPEPPAPPPARKGGRATTGKGKAPAIPKSPATKATAKAPARSPTTRPGGPKRAAAAAIPKPATRPTPRRRTESG